MPRDERSAATPSADPSGSRPIPDASDSLVGRRLSDRYEVLALVGMGGAGHVYQAVQHPLGRRVAIKVMRTDVSGLAAQEFAQRFLREASMASRLHHPNVVTVFDFGDDGGVLYVAMELLQGRTLHRALKAGPLPPEECARIGIGLARGLRHAHEQGMVHRDVKPLNVMLVVDDEGREQPKLMDFGLVKSMNADDSMTVVGQFMGTPAFMSPEQARGQGVDGRTDLYALGVVLFRMLSGRLPFEADHPIGFAVQHQTEPIPAMAIVAPNAKVPTELEQIVRRAMAKAPEDRFPDAAAMAEALDRWLAWRTRPSPTVPPPNEVGPPRTSRGRALLAAGLVVAMGVGGIALLVVGLAGLGLGFLQGRDQPPMPVEPVVLVVPPTFAEPDLTPPPEAAPSAPPPEGAAPTPVAVPKETAAPKAPGERKETGPDVPRGRKAVDPKRPEPRPEPSPAVAAPPGGVVVDDVPMTAAQAAALVALVNRATPDELAAWGVYDQGVGVILQSRPFTSAEQFGATRGIGKKTVEVLVRQTP